MLTTNGKIPSTRLISASIYPIQDLSLERPDTSIQIRHAEPKDATALHQLFTEPSIAQSTVGLPVAPAQAVVQGIAASGEGHYSLVATHATDEVVGFLGLTVSPTPRLHRSAKIGPVAVRPTLKGKGIGSRLMATAIDLADNWLNLHRLELLVFTNNPAAIALYQKFGFEIEGTLRDLAFQSGQYVDAHIMARLTARRG
jgi:putative acetyltransferase